MDAHAKNNRAFQDDDTLDNGEEGADNNRSIHMGVSPSDDKEVGNNVQRTLGKDKDDDSQAYSLQDSILLYKALSREQENIFLDMDHGAYAEVATTQLEEVATAQVRDA